MVTMDPMHHPVDKKSAIFTSYQQSFRIDDLINSNPQPDHYPPPSLPSPPPSSGRIEDRTGGMGMVTAAVAGKPVRLLNIIIAVALDKNKGSLASLEIKGLILD